MGAPYDKYLGMIISPVEYLTIQGIFKVLGIEDQTKTLTDLTVTQLLTPGAADASARRNSKRAAQGNLERYFKSYRAFQRDYRKKYSKQFMLRQGYAPNSTALSRIIIEEKAKTYIQNLYGYANVNLETTAIRYLTEYQKQAHAIQQVTGYNFSTTNIERDGKIYTNHKYEYATNIEIQITSTRNFIDTIMDNLEDNYDYDGVNVIINGTLYKVGPFVDEVNAQDKYETICTGPVKPIPYKENIYSYLIENYSYNEVSREVLINGITYLVPEELAPTINNDKYTVIVSNGVNPDETIDVPVVYTQAQEEIIYTQADRIVNNVTNIAYLTEADLITYRVTSGEVGTELRYWIGIAGSNPDIYDTMSIDITTIIALKEDNVIIDTDDYKLNRMLRKLNLSGDVLRKNLENPQIDNAYLMTGIDPTSNRLADIKVLFRTFDMLAPGSGDIVISVNRLSLKYSFNITKNFINGVIGPVGTYTKSMEGSGNAAVMTLRHQGSATEYKELVVKNFIQTYEISGYGFAAYLTTGGGYCRIAVPLDVLNKLQYKDFVDVYEYGLCLLAYAHETIEIKWYETSAFGTVLKIVGIVITLYTLGGASSIGAALWGIAGAAAVMLAASMIAQLIGGTAGLIIGALVGIVAMAYFGGYGFDTSELWLMIADRTIGVINQSIAMEAEKISLDRDAYMSEMEDKMEELTKLSKEFENDAFNPYINSLHSAYAGTPNIIFRDIAAYCESIVGTTDLNNLVDYSYQIEQAISLRLDVWSGP